MELNQLLNELAHQGIKLSVEGEQLSIRAPSGALTPDLRRRLSENKASLLELLRKTAPSQEPRAQPSLVPAPGERHLPFPLTDIQQAYWIGRSQSPEMGNVGCHVYWELDSTGMDLERLSSAWQRLIARHDMLRAIILPEGQQRILEQVPAYTIKVLDLTEAEPGVAQEKLGGLRRAMSHRVFQTNEWPLFDVQAVRLAENRTRIFLSLDMLIMDGASIQQILEEWHKLYEAPATGLAPLALSFRDYVLAEEALKGSEEYRRSEAYWRGRLSSLPLAPELPVLPLPAGHKAEFVRRTQQLEAAGWERLKARAAKAGLTPSGVLCAAYAEVLAAWSSSPSFSMALTMFRRHPLHPQVGELIGDFTSTIILAVDAPLSTFEQRARHLQARLDQDLDHPHISGVQVLRDLNRLQGSMVSNGIPIVFTSVLGHRQTDSFPLAWLGEIVYGLSQTPQVWLDHQVWVDKGNLVLNWDALEAVFPPGMLDDMFAALGRLVHRLAWEDASWQEPSWELVPVPAAQLEQRARINATQAPVSNQLLHSLFATQARQRPEQLAVIAEDRRLTYGELALRANRIGRLLREQGARPGMLVAVVMEKGWEQVAAVLGILTSGAAYLPLDSALPTERLHYLLAHGQVQLVLTQSKHQERLTWPETVRRFPVDDDAVWASVDPSPLEPVQGPEDLAYVIYTSGSTGQPKGVVIDHRGAVNTILDVNQRFGVGPEDRTLALSSLSFDLSVYDVFGLLAAGGAIVIPEDARRRDPAYWSELVERERVSIWNSVPALMEMWAGHLTEHEAQLPGSLRLVLMSGDWIPVTLPDRIRSLQREGSRLELISMGGATEASIWSILYPIGEVEPEWKSIPYGRPMVNQQFHVLGEALEPRPVWVPGALYIGGIGLAKGYWKDAEKTQASFITHPRTGERLYRTGDIGRYLPDGNIEFLGRRDGQVKVGGNRIELGEIESALVQHPAVQHAAVVAKGQPRGNRRLVAYVVPQPAQQEAMPLEGVITDPGARLEFKLRKPGLRKDEEGRATLALGLPAADDGLQARYAERRSHRRFDGEPLPLERFSRILSSLREQEVDGRPKRYYGSAGSLYPVQTYVYVEPGRVEGVEGGTYYYHPVKHQLITLSSQARIGTSIHFGENKEIAQGSAFSIFLVGQLQAIEPLYGSYARDFCMLEAGYLSQLLMMAAPSQQVGLCPIGILDFEAVRGLFALEEGHVFLHAHVGGGIERVAEHPQTTPASAASKLGKVLREFLLSKLPDYMVPTMFVQLEVLPLTGNGKVDRQALSAREDVIERSEAQFVEVQGELEERLAAIAREIFKVEKIGAEQNFFELGATSMHMIQLANRIRDLLGRQVSITDIFRYPAIRPLAAFLEQGQSSPAPLQETKSRAEARRAARLRRRSE